MGVVLSRRFSGACVALRWHDDGQRYRCAMVDDPAQVLGSLPPWLARQAARLAGRWIAAGIGCDCSLEAAPQAEVDDAVTQRPARDGHEPRRTRA